MKEIYVLSGLGADERVFRSIRFSNKKIIFIKWIPPSHNESIESYAKRLIQQIGSSNPTLVGLSFGGMMAVEIGKQIEVAKVILISSAKTKSEIPFYFRWAGLIGLDEIIPMRALRSTNRLARWFFGIETDQEKVLLKQIFSETDPVFLKWAVGRIANWKNTQVPKNLIHIHGSADRLLPLMNCDFEIKDGGHLMIMNKAREISELLQAILD
ncbi:MAG TPA: alpha/beta hydrolase family protein [Cyclobacteriaceae bacterium]|jgi:pimeloyl-ACP methyl ester carboxylesterase|nr:alpha/beta hydrolase family protein [Cyclobacteriaceae bacterium]